MIEVVCAGYAAVGKFFVERAVVAEAGGDVSPFGEERLIGGAASDIAADSDGTGGDAVPDVDHRSLPRRVEKAAAGLIDDPAAFAACSDGVVFAKIPRERCGAIRHAWRRNCNRAGVQQGRVRDPLVLQETSLNTSQEEGHAMLARLWC